MNVPIIPVNGLKTWKKVITKDIGQALWKTVNLSVNLVWKNSWKCRKKSIPVPNVAVLFLFTTGNVVSVRQCALKKDVETCGDCPDMESCQTVGEIISNNPDALKNLRG